VAACHLPVGEPLYHPQGRQRRLPLPVVSFAETCADRRLRNVAGYRLTQCRAISAGAGGRRERHVPGEVYPVYQPMAVPYTAHRVPVLAERAMYA